MTDPATLPRRAPYCQDEYVFFVFSLNVTTLLFGTYLFILSMFRAIIEKRRADIELLQMRMKFEAFQERQTSLYEYDRRR